MKAKRDAVELKVLWDRLIAITQDAGATMVRTTFSPIVQEGNDYCCSLIDLNGRQLAEPPHTIPSFTGTLPFTVRHFLRRFPLITLKPGDSLITNDSWLGTGHLNDFNVATPVFDRHGRLMAIAACTAHMTDIGGSINYGATRDIHEEGLRLPMMKIADEGRLNNELIELIAFNVRLPEACLGDLTGMLAANKTMADRLIEMIEDEGIGDFASVSDDIQQRSEEAMRTAIADIPSGHYEGQVTFDSAGFPVQICAAVDIDKRSVRVNFDGTSRQIRDTSINVVMNYTYAFTVYPLKLLINPRLATNDGCLRPLEVTAPVGSILNSTWPAGGFSRNYVGHMIHAALFSALEGVLPERVWGHSGSAPTGPDCVMGVRRDGRPFVQLFFAGSGGTGAMPDKDGETCNFPTNARATSVEVTEAAAPILFERRDLLTDSGGPGKHRGGLGSAWTIRNIGSENITYTGQVGRINYPALGLLGGGDGRPNRLFHKGEPEERGWGRWDLRPGDSFRKEGAGGGGLGSPFLRDPAKVLDDVREGHVSEREARETYGVIIQDDRIVGPTKQRERASRVSSVEGN
jgi:N-methylhydantoinase B